jgi:NADH-quinone oxidoreductase subunit J
MVLFLFVLMLVGVDSADSLVETLRGQRLAAIVLGLGFAGLLAFPLGKVIRGQPAAGLTAANAGGNMHAIARLLFTDYVFAFEAVSALLVIAAVGAMVLGHRERIGPKITQKETLRRRIADGRVLTPLPGPGVYARSDSADQRPALPGPPRPLVGPTPDVALTDGGNGEHDGTDGTGEQGGTDGTGEHGGSGGTGEHGGTDDGSAGGAARTDSSPDGSAPVGAGKGSGR